MPDPEKLLKTIRRATELFRATPGRSGGIITLESAEEVLVVGDLHGNIPAFRKVLDAAALTTNPARHLVLQELVHGIRCYPDDGGDRSHQLVDVVSALKCQFPDRVHLILGNHELSEITGRMIGKNGIALNALFRQGITTAYAPRDAEVYSAYLELFAALPIAVRTPNRVFLCHTIPDPVDLDHLDLELLKANTWTREAMARHGTIYAMTWGRNTDPATIDQFAGMVDADWFITGHQPCDEGFRQANHRQLIIDGTDPYPTYCLFPARAPVSIETLLKGVHVFGVID
ncbi:Calcineurin-like phosphoesterase [Singulisphaera sp. GP187]|uniref:metallophosphoesterase n=1 Tax=Singulisphaera sp. GP187 TaxID=1882752 RepID=UPI000928D646|nr:metallophosphoesterase [Singulisphaera sp. GP187]SIN93237.1 Calcineurin-like phosphoesterase [Singulisphaera sp. GP187]